MKNNLLKSAMLFCCSTLLVSAITIISVTTAHAEGTELEMKPIKPKGYEAQYYSGTMSWCCYDGESACVPSNC